MTYNGNTSDLCVYCWMIQSPDNVSFFCLLVQLLAAWIVLSLSFCTDVFIKKLKFNGNCHMWNLLTNKTWKNSDEYLNLVANYIVRNIWQDGDHLKERNCTRQKSHPKSYRENITSILLLNAPSFNSIICILLWGWKKFVYIK